MSTPQTDHDLIVEIHTKMEMLIANGGSKGLIPDTIKRVDKHQEQIVFWRGALAVIGFSMILLGTFFAGHVFSNAHIITK